MHRRQTLTAALLLLFVSAGAHAQVCKETGSNGNASGSANVACDHSFRDALIACDTKSNTDVIGARGACPDRPMPMKETPRKSYIADYTPYLWTFPREPSDTSRPYAGAYSIGTQSDASKSYQLFGNSPAGTRRLAACTQQIRVPNDPKDGNEDAKLQRLQADNCTNQFLLQSAIYPTQQGNDNKFADAKYAKLPDTQLPGDDKIRKITLESDCQPLKTFEVTSHDGMVGEFDPSAYLKAAWDKTIVDSSKRKYPSRPFQYIPCSDQNRLLCDHEPMLPKEVKIENPINPPSDFPKEVRLSTLAAVKYEGINDPTHPFSPRWDFRITDREYGYPTVAALQIPSAAKIYTQHLTYMKDTKDTIYCAGVRKAKDGANTEEKSNQEVKVDVLEFRRKAYEDALDRRTTYNAACYIHKAKYKKWTSMQVVAADPTVYCYMLSPFKPGKAKELSCWDCFRLKGKVGDTSRKDQPPCKTNYKSFATKKKQNADLSIRGSNGPFTLVIPGLANRVQYIAQCNYPLQPRNKKYEMPKVCEDLRKPFTMLNRLKMRYHNPDDKNDTDKNNVALKEGVGEGLWFKEYFGNHMPYPKLWDVGNSIQKNANNKGLQQATDTYGQYTAIVGVGREAATKAAGGDPEKKTDQRCITQGWGSGSGLGGLPGGLGGGLNFPSLPGIPGLPGQGVDVGGAKFRTPDPITSWTELKLYQARTMSYTGLSCLGRYEKVFKPGSAENLMLLATGGEWQKFVVAECDRKQAGATDNCSYKNLSEYLQAGSPKSTDSKIYIQNLSPTNAPNMWRGYLSAKENTLRFPTFGGGTPSTVSGLDKAQAGDIVIMPNGAGADSSSPGLPKLSLVIETCVPGDPSERCKQCNTGKNCFVKVLEPDGGKFPDVCGTTDTWGEMKTRYYFKPGHLPETAKNEYQRISWTTSCVESRHAQCEQSGWDNLKLYRIRNDERDGTDKPKAVENEQ